MGEHSKPDVQEQPDDEPELAERPLMKRLFAEKYLPHWGFGFITAFYVGFNIAVGVAAVPPTISLGWGTTLGLWFHYLIGLRKDTTP